MLRSPASRRAMQPAEKGKKASLHMHLRCRPAKDQDIAVICGFPRNATELFYMFPKATFPLTPGQLSEAIASRSDSTVAEYDGKAAAFANFHQWETGGCCAIGNVAVAPAVRGQGVGRYLIQQMIKLAVSRHRATEVRISCFNANVIGLLLYAKLGFVPFALEERRDEAGRRAALIHFRLPLREEL